MNTKMAVTFDYVLQRLKEPSTWAGLAAILAVVGVQFAPESQDAVVEMFKDIGSLFGTVTGVIQIFWKKDTQSQPKGTGDGH